MNKKVMALTVFVSLLAGGTASLILDTETPYFCEDTQQICIGTHLSPSGISCYFIDEEGNQRSKQCRESPHWQVYENQEVEKEIVEYTSEQNAKQWKCSYNGCYPI